MQLNIGECKRVEYKPERWIIRSLRLAIHNVVAGISCIQGMPNCTETGGLSGAPLRERSTEVVRLIADHVQGALPIIASGGAGKVEDFPPAIEAGADAVLAASVFHYGILTIADVKAELKKHGYTVR